MWRTSNGDRTLIGAEAALVRESIAYMVDTLSQEEREGANHWAYDIPVFDRLSWQQQLAVLVDVGEALFCVDVPVPELAAFNEGQFGAIFENIRQGIEFELDGCECNETKTWHNWCLTRSRTPRRPRVPVRLNDCLRSRARTQKNGSCSLKSWRIASFGMRTTWMKASSWMPIPRQTGCRIATGHCG